MQYLLNRGAEDVAQVQKRLSALFVDGLKQIDNLHVYGDFSGPRVNVFALNIGEAESALVSELLWEDFGIATRAGFHCAPLMHKELRTEARGAVRFSLSLFTTEAEIKAALAALRDIAAR